MQHLLCAAGSCVELLIIELNSAYEVTCDSVWPVTGAQWTLAVTAAGYWYYSHDRWRWWQRTHVLVQEMQGTQVRSLGREDPLEEGMATLSSVLAWRIPWTEEPGGIQPMRSRRVRHDWVSNTHLKKLLNMDNSQEDCWKLDYSFFF